MTPLGQSIIALALYCGLLTIAAFQDLIQLKISNIFSVAVFLVALGGTAWLAPASSWWLHGASFALIFAISLALFSFGWFGGGDAKLLSAAALAFPVTSLLWFASSVAILGGLIALLILAIRIVLPKSRMEASGIKVLERGSALPYGIAIAAGSILAATVSAPVLGGAQY